MRQSNVNREPRNHSKAGRDFLENSSRKQRAKNNFILRGKSDEYMHGLSEAYEDTDPQKKFELEEDLELFSRNENLYHGKVIDDDIKKVIDSFMPIIEFYDLEKFIFFSENL